MTPGPLVAQRRVRMALRRGREAKGLTQEAVAEAMEWSLAKVVRTESGVNSISHNDLRPLLSLYGIDPQVTAELLGLARTARQRPWWTQYRDWVPRPRLLAAAFAAEAATVMSYSQATIPTELRTEAYAHAVLSAQEFTGREHDLRLEVERRWRDEFHPVTARFVLDEAVLHRAYGGSLTHAEQLDHLVAMSGRDAVAIRVLPFARPGNPVSSFALAVFDDADSDGVVFIDATPDGYLIDDPRSAVLAGYHRTFDRLWNAALAVADSQELIKSRAAAAYGSA